MKYISAIFLLMFMLALTGCGENYDGDPHYYYALKIKVVDDSGTNIIKGIDINEDYSIFNPSYSYIDDNLYSVEVRFGEEIRSKDLTYVIIKNEEYLNFDYYTLFEAYPTIIQRIKCERIFGDEKEHEIVADYSIQKRIPRLAKVTFDGVEQTIYDETLVTVTVRR